VAEHHARVVYLPDSVDRSHFRNTKTYPERPGAPPTAIWCGVAVKAPDLEPVVPLLRARGIPLVVVAERKPRLSGSFEFVRWRHATAPRDLMRGDVCVAPRGLDTPYNLGHSFFKIGIFLAQGVPALASPVPSYAEVLRDEQTGLVCESSKQWEAGLDRLLEDPRLLARWSPAAVEALRPYWTESVAAEYRRLFLELADGRA
jgi:hypothetical protein